MFKRALYLWMLLAFMAAFAVPAMALERDVQQEEGGSSGEGDPGGGDTSPSPKDPIEIMPELSINPYIGPERLTLLPQVSSGLCLNISYFYYISGKAKVVQFVMPRKGFE